MPFFSIITCTKNSENYLNETIESVKSQSFKDYEHIFIDGFSTDKTLKIISEYQKTNSTKIKIFQFKPKGITDAMNHGILSSNGNYLIHLHSDDYFDNDSVLSSVHKFIGEHNMCDWIFGNARHVDAKRNQLRIFNSGLFHGFNHYNYFRRQILKYRDAICHQSVFINKAVFDTYGLFDDSDKNTADYDMWLRIYKRTKWYYLDKIVSCFRVHSGSNSTSAENHLNMLISSTKVQKRHLNTIEFYIIRPIIEIIIAIIIRIKLLIKIQKNLHENID